MMQLTEQSIHDLARCAIATATIEEAHADDQDIVRKVVIALPEWAQNAVVRKEIAGLWQHQGLIASINGEGYLMIDGVKEQKKAAEKDLVGEVQRIMGDLGSYLPDLQKEYPDHMVDSVELHGHSPLMLIDDSDAQSAAL